MIGHCLQSIARYHLLPRRSPPLDHHVTHTGTISELRNWNTLTDSTWMKWLSGSRSTDQRSTRKEGKKGSSRAYYPPVAFMRIRTSLTSGSIRTKKMRDVVSGSCQTKNSRLGRCLPPNLRTMHRAGESPIDNIVLSNKEARLEVAL